MGVKYSNYYNWQQKSTKSLQDYQTVFLSIVSVQSLLFIVSKSAGQYNMLSPTC